jgi:hypothetical protein
MLMIDNHLQSRYRLGSWYAHHLEMGKWKVELMIAKPLSIEDVEVAPPKADEVRIKVL